MKKCKYCQTEIDSKAKVCPHCRKKQSNIQKWIIIGVVVILVVPFLIGVFADEPQTNDDNQNTTKVDNNEKSKEKIELNKPFEFDDLEITISSKYSFDVVDNKFSDYHKQSVVKVPVTVKNLKDETHSLNMFNYSLFGSKGTELENVSSLFDDGVDEAGDLKTGASYTKYFYLLYDGDGTYSIEFDDWSDKITVNFDVKK